MDDVSQQNNVWSKKTTLARTKSRFRICYYSERNVVVKNTVAFLDDHILGSMVSCSAMLWTRLGSSVLDQGRLFARISQTRWHERSPFGKSLAGLMLFASYLPPLHSRPAQSIGWILKLCIYQEYTHALSSQRHFKHVPEPRLCSLACVMSIVISLAMDIWTPTNPIICSS